MQVGVNKFVCGLVAGVTLKSCPSNELLQLTNKLPHHAHRRLIWMSTSMKNIPQSVSANANAATVTTTGTGTSPDGERKWDIYAGLVLERRPVITKDLTPLEKRYKDFFKQYEVELSKKSDHEVRHENDSKLLEQIKKGEVDQGNIQTAQDFEDACNKELSEFQPASRRTEADDKNDTKSLQRALDSHLLLVVSQKLGKDYKWIVPHVKRTDENSLREVADKTLQNICPSVKTRVLGNAPWAYYTYKYPPGTMADDGTNLIGAKVFFYKAQILPGQNEFPLNKTSSAATIKDYHWATRAELPTHFTKEYFHVISDILIPEFS